MKEVVNIQSASKRYIQQAIQIVFALFLLELLILQMQGAGLLLTPVLVSMCFALIVELSDAFIWKRLENKKKEETKATFFMAVSGFRFLLALLMLFVYYFMSDRSGMIAFILLFAPYYLAVLVHHSIFFSHLRSKS